MYEDLKFPQIPNRPFFYTNFVSTVDGKIQVIGSPAYWPIGSKIDYQTLIELRSYADVLLHGKTTAEGHRTLDTLASEEFVTARQKRGKTQPLIYAVMSNSPDEKLIQILSNAKDIKVMVITNEKAVVPESLSKVAEIIRVGHDDVSVEKLSALFFFRGLKCVLVEGGPTVLGSFLNVDLIDEVFLTVAPKIFGSLPTKTLTMVEGVLFPPDKIKNLNIISVKQVENELYLRYWVKH